jgi:hypothetical protein
MFKNNLFRVEEIGIPVMGPSLFFKGRQEPLLFRERELIRYMFAPRYKRDIASLTQGVMSDEASFARNVFKLTENPIEEISIKINDEGNKKKAHVTSNLRFMDKSVISGVSPQHGLIYTLTCLGMQNCGNVYCHNNLYQQPGPYTWIKFKKISEIKLEEKKPEVYPNTSEYEKISFDRILWSFHFPDSLVYKNGQKEYAMKFPINKPTFDKVMSGEKTEFGGVVYRDIDNPQWQTDSMSIISESIRKSGIELETIFLDANPERHVSENFWRYSPIKANVVLNRNGKRIVTPAPCDLAVSLGYLFSKDLWLKNNSKAYVI